LLRPLHTFLMCEAVSCVRFQRHRSGVRSVPIICGDFDAINDSVIPLR
jgi:hypothetical protein